VPEAARAARARLKLRHDLQFDLHDRHDDELRDAFPRLQREGLPGAVPAGDHEFALVVRIDEANEIAEHDAMAVAESRPRQDHSGQARILKIDRKPGRYEFGASGGKLEGRFQKGPQIKAGGATGCVRRQRKFDPKPGIENAHP
jgi:hypothetical protein